MPVSAHTETKMLHFAVSAKGITTAEDGQEFGQIECYGAIYGNVDEGNDRIIKGAFARTIQNSKSRAKAREKKYILPILWQHDANELIGGWYDLTEDETGLLCKGEIALATQRGREYYALAKAGMSDQFSIIYDVPTGGARYDKSGVRDLTELRLFSIDVVTFAMNEETRLVGVKSMTDLNVEYKSVCGSTSGPIGPRDESWDGAAAKKWIWSQALDDEGNVKPAVAKKYFMRVDGDPSLKTSYGYPFWTHDHISVGGVKAVANALSGARNADAEGDTAGMKKKVERLYGRINSKYSDADPLVPPWKDDGDGKSAHHIFPRKDLAEHFQDHQSADLCEDWQKVYLCSLTCAVFDAIKDGSDSEARVSAALDDFKQTVMTTYMPQVMEYDLSGYLEDNPYAVPSPGSSYGYGYMSRRGRLARKELLAADATTGGYYARDGAASGSSHVAKLHQAAEKAMKALSTHVDGLHSAANDIEDLIDDGPDGHDEADELDGMEGKRLAKAGRRFSAANTQALSDHADMLHDMADGHRKAMSRQVKSVRTVADDLATILQGSEPTYADPNAGTPDSGQQEGKGMEVVDISGALASIRSLRSK